MSVLIKGMEMPKYCSQCQMLEGTSDDGLCHAANKWFDDEWFCWYQYPDGDIATDKPLNCPLVPLPEWHGDLIDRDNVLVDIDCTGTNKFGMLDEDIRAFLRRYKPIVQAEGGDDHENQNPDQ